MADDFISGDDDHDPFDANDVARKNADDTRVIVEASNEVRRKLLRRQEAYIRVMKGAAGDGDVAIVVEDLKRFCRGGTTTFDADPRIHVLLTGRQEVYLRIMDHTELSFDDLYIKYTQGE